MFDTKIAIVVREDLATWQKLNVTAFLTSGIVGAGEGLLGERYEDAAGNAIRRDDLVKVTTTSGLVPTRRGRGRPQKAEAQSTP